MYKILGIAGSLREGSFNRAALRAAQSLMPQNAQLEIYESLGEIPPFNQDKETSLPKPVKELKKAIKEADAILLVTPEYNYSVPGVLKNAIDWASRPYGENAWENKVVALMGASSNMLGTGRAQYHLRQMFVFLNIHTLNRPEVMIANAQDKFDENGQLKDQYTIDKIRLLLESLVEKIEKLDKLKNL
jgi:chromate reductase